MLSGELIAEVKKDMLEDSTLENQDELTTYLTEFTLFDGQLYNQYAQQTFNHYFDFYKAMMNDRFKRAEEVKNKGGEFSRTWEDSSFWRTFLGRRLGSLRDYASQMISGGAEWLNMDNVAEFFDREDALYEAKVLEKVRGMSNIRTGGYTSGKSAVVNIKGKDVNFILTEEGTIIDADNDIQYVPADSEEGRAEEKFIRDALENSKDFDWNWDWTLRNRHSIVVETSGRGRSITPRFTYKGQVNHTYVFAGFEFTRGARR